MNAATRFAGRRRALCRLARKDHELNALWITDPADIRYLTGCTEGGFGVLLGPEGHRLLAARMFEHVVPAQAPGIEVECCPKAPERLAELLKAARRKSTLGVQGGHLTWSVQQQLAVALDKVTLVDVADLGSRLRAVKDAEEIGATKECIRIAEAAFRALCAGGPRYLCEHTEKQLAAELEYRMRGLGADRQGFETGGIIVGSGPNSASCHHVPTDRKVAPGEPLLFDWGAEKDGYRSDITRVVFPGTPEPTMQNIYRIVQRANRAGTAAVKAGTTCRAVAAAGWQPVRDAGYGDQIRHGLGHGVGLRIHEYPGMRTGSKQADKGAEPRLRTNMIITIEPGIYLAGVGGVRIEDDVLVQPRGAKVLTSLPRSLKASILAD